MNAIDAVTMQGISSVEVTPAVHRTTDAQFEPLIALVQETNDVLNTSNNLVQRAALGESIAPHELMLGLENAKLQLQMLIEIRNRCVEAYQEVMRMQV
jgi:flagellar hook-basal body complex protein FliE